MFKWVNMPMKPLGVKLRAVGFISKNRGMS